MELKALGRYLAIVLLSFCLLSAAVTVHADDSDSVGDDVEAAVSSEEVEVLEEEPRPPHEPTLAVVTEGQLRGVKEEAHSGKEFYSFRGIPYAAPPEGDLRFEPPQKYEAWEGERDAFTDPPFCPQMSDDNALLRKPKFSTIGQEDCLFLNIFSPMYEQVKPNDPLLPVMVFIHGGGYFSGHANQYQPYVLMSQDIVLVVIQYRLGTFGFLSTEDDVAPGNMGILDQTFALDWIQRNAASFGGNPLSITLFGESAGGSSIHLQMLSHTSLGYFHRAIMQSGTTIASWSMASNHKTVTYFIAKVLGCGKMADAEVAANCTINEENPAEYESCLVDLLSSEEIIKCLKEAPMELLAESSTWVHQFETFPLMMAPRVHENLLMQDPLLLLKEGRFKKMDIMLGFTRDEGAMLSMPLYSNEGMRSALRFKFEEIGPVALDFGPGDIAPLNQTIKIFDHYVGNIEVDRETSDNITAMFGDRLLWYPVDVAAHVHAENWHSKKKNKKTYVYELAHRGAESLTDFYNLDVGRNWINHGDDLMYLFGATGDCFFCFKGPMKNEEDQKISDMMVKMWTNFAATGNPTPDNEPTTWEAFSAAQPQWLVIEPQPHMSEPDKKSQTREFWRQLPIKANLILFPDSVANLTKLEVPVDADATPGDGAVTDEPVTVTDASDGTVDNSHVQHDNEQYDDEQPTKDEL